jgi:hypothetical protein
MKDKTSGVRTCIECKWCEIRLDLEAGSGYLCAATGEPLGAGDVIRRPGCGAWEPLPGTSAFWGP